MLTIVGLPTYPPPVVIKGSALHGSMVGEAGFEPKATARVSDESSTC